MNTRLIRLLTALVTLAALLGAAAPAQAQTERRCFAETGFCIEGRIREFWERNGGLPVFGLPIGPQGEEQIEGRALQVQWFERNRLELHPESPRPYDVQIGRLGADRLAQQGRDWFSFPKSEARDGCRFFAETGHNVCGAVLAAWRAQGLDLDGQRGVSEPESLALFGLPLSDEQSETLSDGKSYTVQWFERARVELHPENQPPYNVLLGLLGTELRGVAQTPTQPAPQPTAPPTPAAALQLFVCNAPEDSDDDVLVESCSIPTNSWTQFHTYPGGDNARTFVYPVTRPITGSVFTFRFWLASLGPSTLEAQIFLRHNGEEVGVAATSFQVSADKFREFTQTTGGGINAVPGDSILLRLTAHGAQTGLLIASDAPSGISIAP